MGGGPASIQSLFRRKSNLHCSIAAHSKLLVGVNVFLHRVKVSARVRPSSEPTYFWCALRGKNVLYGVINTPRTSHRMNSTPFVWANENRNTVALGCLQPYVDSTSFNFRPFSLPLLYFSRNEMQMILRACFLFTFFFSFFFFEDKSRSLSICLLLQ